MAERMILLRLVGGISTSLLRVPRLAILAGLLSITFQSEHVSGYEEKSEKTPQTFSFDKIHKTEEPYSFASLLLLEGGLCPFHLMTFQEPSLERPCRGSAIVKEETYQRFGSK